MNDLEIAQKLVEVFEERSEGSTSGEMLSPHVLASSTYTSVRILDAIIWDTQDECAPPEHGNETFESALAHAEGVIQSVIAAMSALLIPVQKDPIFVVVNGSSEKAPSKTMSHADIVRLAYLSHRNTPKETKYFSVTCHWPKGNREGIIMHDGMTVEVTEGMRFNVSDTGNA